MDGKKQAWLRIFDPVRPASCRAGEHGYSKAILDERDLSYQDMRVRIIHPEANDVRPPVRLNDPVTSRAGAAHVMGEINQRQQFALAAVCQYPNRTAAEIEAAIGCRDGRVRKRLKELVRGGFVEELAPRPCEVTGHNATVYRVTRQGESRGFTGTEHPAGVAVDPGQGGAASDGAMDQSGVRD